MERKFKKAISLETFIFLAVLFAFFYYLSSKMGAINLINTFMNTAYALLMEVCFYIMAIAVVAGGLSAILSEFGVISSTASAVTILSPAKAFHLNLLGATA